MLRSSLLRIVGLALLVTSVAVHPGCLGDPPAFPEASERDSAGLDAGFDAPRAEDAVVVMDAAADASNVDPRDGAEPVSEAGVAGPGASASVRGDPCPPHAPFREPQLVAGLQTVDGSKSIARLSRDQLTIYFSHRSNVLIREVVMAERASVDAPFGPTVSAGIGDGTSSPSLSSDGSLLYFTRDVNGPDLFVAARPFSPRTTRALDALNSGLWDFQSYVSFRGDALYFVRAPSIGELMRSGSADIWVARKLGEQFTTPELLRELNTEEDERSPVLSADGLHLYFAGQRAGPLDIYVASRPSEGEPFGAPVAVSELNSPVDDSPSWVSEDNCTLYFDSNRSGNLEIWRALRR